jgi:hypothetical protein
MIHQDPKFGYDGLGPLLNEASPQLSGHGVLDEIDLVSVLPVFFKGEDALSTDVPLLNPGLDLYFSYVDGFRGWVELVSRFPHAHMWDGLPWGYASASTMQELIDAAGARPFIRASAHVGLGPHVCAPHVCGFPQADFTQWEFHGPQGQNVDQWVGPSMHGNRSPSLVSITITGERAHFADVEPGAMTPAQFPGWYDHVAIQPSTPPKPPTKETVMGVSSTTDGQGHVHVFQETSDGKVWHVRQLAPGGTWDTSSHLLLESGQVPKAAESFEPIQPQV